MLLLRKSQNPPALFPEIASISSMDGRWWVAHTKSRFEKAFAWDLIEKQISYFLPMVRRVHWRGGTKRTFHVPLFTSYVFFCGSRDERTDALATGRLWRVIDVADQSTLVRELSHLQIALGTSGSIERCRIRRGQKCRVNGGPMQGFSGVVIEDRKVTRLVLQISILGQGFSLEIDRDLLEPIDAGPRPSPVPSPDCMSSAATL
jgi:transcription antitermination factor NusG